MNLLVVSGFLGSGKTTLLLAIARALTHGAGRRVAIVENEVGKVGIDDHALRENGLDVREIYSGCVCCSLRIDLIQTLLALEREVDPDVVILEPSGVAGPRQVLDVLQGYGGEIDRCYVLAIVDASRFHLIQNLAIPLVQDGVAVANLIALNKADLVDGAAMETLETRLRELRRDAPLLRVSGATGENVAALAARVREGLECPSCLPGVRRAADSGEAMAPGAPSFSPAPLAPAANPAPLAASAKSPLAPAANPAPLADGFYPVEPPRPTVFAREVDLVFERPAARDAVAARVASFLQELAAELHREGCLLIGHLKAGVKTNGCGLLLLSMTEFDRPPEVKGALAASVPAATLTLNAIVYGLKRERLEAVTREAMGRLVGCFEGGAQMQGDLANEVP